ncbi:MAG: phosphoadenosine phosphosulfate reductase [Acidobacteriota bacterium]
MKTQELLVVSFGAGVDSTAMLVEMKNRRIRPDLILFADTGAEKPETYQHLETMNGWLRSVGFPEVTVVRYVPPIAPYKDLEGNCLANETLPSLAFGMKSCSLKWKVKPQHKYLDQWGPALELWAEGKKVRRALGYDNGCADRKRSKKVTVAVGLDNGCADKKRSKTYAGNGQESEKYDYWYPLQDWDVDREGCVQIIEAEGIPVPPKSSCFFCPAMKKEEILELRDKHPDLLKRAIDLENNARFGKHGLKSTKGLGRRFAWADFLNMTPRKEE